jgi:transcriptional regulator with XRE-family HTH domain
VGREIRRRREEAGHTQRQLAERADLAVAYLSRLENDRVTPTLRTMDRLAAALGVKVAALLDREVHLESPDRCPVSLSGQCVLDERSGRQRRRRESPKESYSTDDLNALRLCNLLLQSGDRQAVRTLVAVMNGLLAMKPVTKAAPSGH